MGDVITEGLTNGEADLVTLLDAATRDGTVALVIDQPGSIAQLVRALARSRHTLGVVCIVIGVAILVDGTLGSIGTGARPEAPCAVPPTVG